MNQNYLIEIRKNELLKHAFRHVLMHNQSWNNPYHNNEHLLNVFEKSMYLSKIYKIPEREKVELGVASLFHDFNHSGGKLKDSENIDIAIHGFKLFHQGCQALFERQHADTANIEYLIKCTEYPHQKELKTIQEQIIIDADMSSFLNNNWFTAVIFGFLHKESGLSIYDAVCHQIEFMKKVDFYTNEIKQQYDQRRTQILKHLDQLIKIFTPGDE